MWSLCKCLLDSGGVDQKNTMFVMIVVFPSLYWFITLLWLEFLFASTMFLIIEITIRLFFYTIRVCTLLRTIVYVYHDARDYQHLFTAKN